MRLPSAEGYVQSVKELTWLPRLARRLPLPIPAPDTSGAELLLLGHVVAHAPKVTTSAPTTPPIVAGTGIPRPVWTWARLTAWP